ncbi:MAG: DNA internalization-related competence protein ComEC/Rec2 [Halanaerobiales bacterium]
MARRHWKKLKMKLHCGNDFINKAPLLFAAVTMMAGVIAGYYLYPVVSGFLIALVVAVIIYFSSSRKIGISPATVKGKKHFLYIFIMVTFILGCFLTVRAEYRYESKKSAISWTGQEVLVVGRVIEPLSDLEGEVLYIKPQKVDGKQAGHGLIQVQREELAAKEGRIISARMYLEKPRRQMNPGGFSYLKYLKWRGIYVLGYPQGDINYGGLEGPGIKRGIIKLKKYLLEVIDENMDKPYSGTIKALILGERSELSVARENSFTEAGVSHLLAISGLHVGFVVLILFWISETLSLPLLPRNLAITGMILLYIIITGGRSSVLRAGLLSVLFLWAPYFNRRGSIFNCLGFALLVNLTLNPYTLFSPGTQLTYLVVGSIVLWSDIFKNFLLSPVAVSTSAQLGSLPITAFHFNTVVPMGIVTNLWAVPLTGLIVILAFGGLIMSLIHPLFFTGVGMVVQFLLQLLEKGIELCAGLPGSSIEISTPSIVLIVLYYIYVFGLPYLLKKRYIPLNVRRQKRRLIAAGAAATVIFVVIVLPVSLFEKELEVVFLSVDQGDSIYLETPRGENILIDGGGGIGPDGSHGESTVLPFLRHRGISELDLVAVTHFHEDHVRGVIDIIEERRVKNLLLPAGFARNELFRELITRVAAADIPVQVVSAGIFLESGDFQLQVLHPEEDGSFQEENENSLVLRGVYGNFSLLLTGDLESKGEKVLLEKYDIESSILKFAHHGGASSSGKEFLGAVNPAAGIISCGKNVYGHPAPEVMERARELGIEVYRTDQSGAIIVRTDGKIFTVEEFIK